MSAAALLDSKGRCLLATRPPGKSMAGLWEFPGGKLHAAESPRTALKRELSEELGLIVNPDSLQHLVDVDYSYADFHLHMIVYVTKRWRGTPNAKEGQELAWVHPNDFAEYAMPPADGPVCRALADYCTP